MQIRYVFMLTAFSVFLASCQKDWPDQSRQTGSVHIEIGLFVRVNDVSTALKATQQTEDFRVCIFTSEGNEVLSFDRASDMPAEIELETGDYYVSAFSDNDLPAAFENPYYYGESEVFTLGSEQVQSVSVTCAMANAMVTIVYSDQALSSFTTCETTVASSLGSLLFTGDETRAGYFRPLPLSITAVLTRQRTDGSSDVRTLTGQISSVQANRHYEIHIDASAGEGSASFEILLDESPVPVEIVEISEEGSDPVPGAIAYGELLITEIMFDPSALADTEGEWFEVLNNSGRTLDLQNLVILRDDANLHVVSEDISLEAGAGMVFERTVQATGAEGYVYGSAISLTNTGAVLSLHNEGTDGSPGSLIFSVDYGEAGFPAATGASISLDPSLSDPVNALLGTSWCIAASAYDTGDLGTPGQANESCGP